MCSPKYFILCSQLVTVLFEDYAELEEEEEIEALESCWVQHFGVVSPNVKAPFEEEILTLGVS